MKKGYITLMTVLIIMTVTLGISLTLFNMSFESIYRNYSNNTQVIIESDAINCRENILLEIFNDTSYTATDVVSGTCTYSVSDNSPTEKRLEIRIDKDDFVQRFVGIVSIGLAVEVTSWNKVINFVEVNNSIVTDGLVLNLDAGDPSSYPGAGTNWTNLASIGNDATLLNGVGFNSANQGSLTFDGIDDRGTFTSPITSNSPQTYEVWVKAISSPSSDVGIGYILHNNSLNNWIGTAYLGIGYAGNTVASQPLQNGEIYASFNGSWLNMGTGIIGDSNTVRQIVLTWDGVNQTAYVDGVQRVSQPLVSTPSNFSNITSFGDERSSSFRRIIGDIYSIKVYDKALTGPEIQQNFDALRGRYGL